MNIYYATFRKTDSHPWMFITKIYKADYVEDARINAVRDWNKNFKDWKMTFYDIPYFDEFGSYKVSEVHK